MTMVQEANSNTIGSMDVVVFAGAGASKAVNPRLYPTTVEFFDRLPANVSNHTLFSQVVKRLQLDRPAGSVDIEQVLWALRAVTEFLKTASDERTVPGWLLRSNRLLGFSGTNADFSVLFSNAPVVLNVIDQLTRDINEQVYAHYHHVPTQDELASTWTPLLNHLTARGRVDVFTTNYDRVIEAAIRTLVQPKMIDTGRREDGVERYLQERLWANTDNVLFESGGLLTKLHGSVDWAWDQDKSRIFVSDPLFKGHDRAVMLYPGFKGAPASPPFNLFHDYLINRIAAADLLIFIGFAFRDEYINEILRRFRRLAVQTIVVDPGSVATPFPLDSFRHIKESFSIGAFSDLLANLDRPTDRKK